MTIVQRGRLVTKLATGVAITVLSGLLASQAFAKSLVYCSESAPEGFDPALYSSNSTWDASSKPVYSRLVEFENGTTNVVPGLAESWSISDDKLEYTFKLHKGVKFQTTDYFTPTRELTADDVLFSLNRQRLKNDPWYTYIAGSSYEIFESMEMQALIKDIVKVDDQTVKIVLNQPSGSLLAMLAMDFGSVMSKEYADKLAAAGTKEKLNQQPIGTGPCRFVD